MNDAMAKSDRAGVISVVSITSRKIILQMSIDKSHTNSFPLNFHISLFSLSLCTLESLSCRS